MASGYYGQRGETIRQMQQAMKDAGANITVDGIWGKNTEAAYNQYSNIFTQPTAPTKVTIQAPTPYEYKPLEYTPVGEDDMRAQITAQYDPGYQKSLNELAEARKYQEAAIKRDARARGMSQSSYLLEALNSLDKSTTQQQNYLATNYNQQYNAALSSMKDQEYARKLAIDQFNAQMRQQKAQYDLSYQQYLQQKSEADRQYELQLRQYNDQLNRYNTARSAGSGSGGSSGGSSTTIVEKYKSQPKAPGGGGGANTQSYDEVKAAQLRKIYGGGAGVSLAPARR